MPQMIEVDPHPFSTSKLERRDEIAVTSDYDECSNHVSKRQPGNVETDAQIDPFLLYGGHEIGRTGRPGTPLHAPECAVAEFPSASTSSADGYRSKPRLSTACTNPPSRRMA